MNILSAIGNTSIVQLRRIVPPGSARVLALGAKVETIPSEGKRITEPLFRAMITRAEEIARERGAYRTDQLNNRDAARGYYGLGEEIWGQAALDGALTPKPSPIGMGEGRVDAYVESVHRGDRPRFRAAHVGPGAGG